MVVFCLHICFYRAFIADKTDLDIFFVFEVKNLILAVIQHYKFAGLTGVTGLCPWARHINPS